MEWILIAIGGGVGSTLRYAVIELITKLNYPANYATVTVNIIGSFLLGLVLQKFNGELLLSFLALGLLGALTTFSTFAYDFFNLYKEREFRKGIIYLSMNLVGGLFVFAVGFYI